MKALNVLFRYTAVDDPRLQAHQGKAFACLTILSRVHRGSQATRLPPIAVNAWIRNVFHSIYGHRQERGRGHRHHWLVYVSGVHSGCVVSALRRLPQSPPPHRPTLNAM